MRWREDEEERGGQGGRDCRRGGRRKEDKRSHRRKDKEQGRVGANREVGRRRTPVKNQTHEGEEGSMAGRGGKKRR